MIVRRCAMSLLAAALFVVSVGQAAEPRKNAHVLLIGATFYENLPKSKHLEGPTNDVELLSRILTETFHFDPAQIAKLTEQPDKDHLPTRANIQREFERLAKSVKEGDQVVIHVSGLGSQQPQLAGAADPEPDGLNKIFLPRDAGKWDAVKRTVVNAILDDEIAAWVKAIRDRKASVCLIYDVCHAGSVSPGAGNERTRELDMVKDLGIPSATIDAARADGLPRAPFKLTDKDGIVAICATMPTELTVERAMPLRAAKRQVHGLLSYTLAAVLTQAAEGAQPITYSELARRVQARYISWGRSFPTVQVEGGDRDRAIFGDKVWPGRLSIQLGGKAGALTVNAGALHGLTPDSILSVIPPVGKGTDRLGYLLVKEVRRFEADVVPCDKDGKAATTEFPAAAVCEKHIIAAGPWKLRVAIDPIDGKGRRISAEFEKLLRAKLVEAAKESAVLEVADSPDQTDWLVRRWSLAEDRIILVPAAGWSDGRDGSDISGLGPWKLDDATDVYLGLSLEAIHRANVVTSLPTLVGNRGSVRVTAELIRYASRRADDIKKPLSVPWAGAAVPLYDRELVALRLSNPSKVPIDVSVLFVSSQYGIACLYPNKGEINRIQPNESVIVPAPTERRPFFTVNSKTVGMEYILIVASKASGLPDNFSVLEQKDLEGTLSRDVPKPIAADALPSPLGQLVRRGATGQGTIRGLTRSEDDEHAAVMIPMLTRKGKRP